MKKLLSAILWTLGVGAMVSMLAVSSINIDKCDTLMLESELLDQSRENVRLEKDNGAQKIMLLQAERIVILEGKLNAASDIINTSIQNIELREKLLVSTAERLQDTINELAKATTELDKKKREVYSLRRSLRRVKAELTIVKKSLLKLNTPTPAPHKSLLDFWKDFK